MIVPRKDQPNRASSKEMCPIEDMSIRINLDVCSKEALKKKYTGVFKIKHFACDRDLSL